MEIFGFSGQLGVGKNFVAERIFQPMLLERKTIFLAFANHFKIDAIVKANLDRTKVFGKKDDHTRRVLQVMGTDEGRNKYGEDIWINLAEEWRVYYESLGYERAIIFDVRFPNEVDYIKNIGGKVIRVESPQRHLATATKEAEANGIDVNTILNHASETSLDGYTDFDLVVKNDFQDNPFIQVRDWIRSYQRQTRPEHVIFLDVDDTIGECHVHYEETINKVEDLLTFAAHDNGADLLELNATYRNFVAAMRHRVDNHEFVRNRIGSDLMWAMTKTLEVHNITFRKDFLTASAYRIGMEVFDYEYKALPGAIEAVRKAQTLGKVVLFTLGDRLEQVKKIAQLGLSDIPFEITHDKNVTTFQGLRRKYPATTTWMVGDNMKRDILPAIEAGIDNTIWINPVYRKSADTDDVKPYDTYETLVEAVQSIEQRINFGKELERMSKVVAKAVLSGPDLVPLNDMTMPTGTLYYPTITGATHTYTPNAGITSINGQPPVYNTDGSITVTVPSWNGVNPQVPPQYQVSFDPASGSVVTYSASTGEVISNT